MPQRRITVHPGTTGPVPSIGTQLPLGRVSLDPELGLAPAAPWTLAYQCSPAWALFLFPHPGLPLGHHQPEASQALSHNTTSESQSHETPPLDRLKAQKGQAGCRSHLDSSYAQSIPAPMLPAPAGSRQAPGMRAALRRGEWGTEQGSAGERGRAVLTAGPASPGPQAPPLAPGCAWGWAGRGP